MLRFYCADAHVVCRPVYGLPGHRPRYPGVRRRGCQPGHSSCLHVCRIANAPHRRCTYSFQTCKSVTNGEHLPHRVRTPSTSSKSVSGSSNVRRSSRSATQRSGRRKRRSPKSSMSRSTCRPCVLTWKDPCCACYPHCLAYPHVTVQFPSVYSYLDDRTYWSSLTRILCARFPGTKRSLGEEFASSCYELLLLVSPST